MTDLTQPPRHKHDKTPKADEILDTLYALVMACNLGHICWEKGKRGHDEALIVLRDARDVLRRSNRYGQRMRELNL